MTSNGIPIQVPTNITRLPKKQEKSGSEEAEFLTLRLLHKHNRVQLSAAFGDLSSWPGRINLFAIANRKGWFVAAAKGPNNSGYQLHFSPIAELRSRFSSEEEPDNEKLSFSCKRVLPIAPYTPLHLKFACQDERFLAAAAEGVLAVYDSASLLSEGTNQVPPIHVFEGSPVTDVQPNTGETPQFIAVMRGETANNYIEILDIQNLSVICSWRSSDDIHITSMSWSLKGKQIAIGLSSGDVVTYSPTDPAAPKLFFPGPQVSGDRYVVGLIWLSKTIFYVIMADKTGQDTENTHFICSHGAGDFITEIELDPAPCPPFGAVRPSGPQVVVLRDWSPFKNLIFLGDGPSSEMSLIANMDNKWSTVLLDESSIPNLPLDEDMNDTAILGYDLDFTSTTPIKNANEEGQKPPAPVLYAYASDGTVVARHVVNDKGGAYHGMLANNSVTYASTTPSSAFMSNTPPRTPIFTAGHTQRSAFDMQDDPPTPPTPKDRDMDDSTFGGLSLGGPSNSLSVGLNKPNNMFGSSSVFPPSGAFGSSTSTSAFGSSSFIKPATSAFGSSVNTSDSNPFAATKASEKSALTFGASGFSVAKPNPGFGFGRAQTSSGSDNKASPSFGNSGFGAAARTPTFGSSGFGSAPPKSESTNMTSGGFGAFADGGGGFGSFTPSNPNAPVASVFASSSPASEKPVTEIKSTNSSGFGAFATGGGVFGAAVTLSNTSIFSSPQTEIASKEDEKSAIKLAFPASGDPSAFSIGNKPSPFTSSTTIKPEESRDSSIPPGPTTNVFGIPTTPTSPLPKHPVQAPGPSPQPPSSQQETKVGQRQPSIVGSINVLLQKEASTTPSGSPFRPVGGYNAFGTMNIGTSPFSSPSQPSKQASSFVSAFGTGGGLSKALDAPPSPSVKAQAPTFGQSAFGKVQAPTFGQSSFGKPTHSPSFGSSTSGMNAKSTPPAADSSSEGSTAFGGGSGGFAAFSSGSSGFAAFSGGSGAFAAKPQEKEKPVVQENEDKNQGLPTPTPSTDTSPLIPKEKPKTLELSTNLARVKDNKVVPVDIKTEGSPRSLESSYEKVSALGSSFASVEDSSKLDIKSETRSSTSHEEGEVLSSSVEEGDEGEGGSEYVLSESSDSTEGRDSDDEADSLLEETGEREETPTASTPKRAIVKKPTEATDQKSTSPVTVKNTKSSPKESATSSSTSKPSSAFNWSAAGLKPPTKGLGWTCPTCMIINSEVSTKCAACDTSAPSAALSEKKQDAPIPKPTMPSVPSTFKTNVFTVKPSTDNTTRSAAIATIPGTESKFGSSSLGLGRPSTRPARSSPLAQVVESENQPGTPSSTAPLGFPTPFSMPKPPGASGGFFQGFGRAEQSEGTQQALTSAQKGIEFSKSPQPLKSFPAPQQQPANLPTPGIPQTAETLMQRALATACEGMYYEFDQLRRKLADVATRHAASDHGEGKVAELSKPLQYVKGGLQELRLRLHEREQLFNELENDLLKQQIQLQHIKLLSAGVKNASFKQMAESRPLDPDQLEKQESLRKSLKECTSLVVQLESKLANVKIGLEAQQHGRISLKTPSLASIDNTCIMLEVNIAAQNKRLERLVRELKANPLSTSFYSLPNTPAISQSDGGVTPNTSRAKELESSLNAIRGRERLRQNLLVIMKQPLLTTKVVTPEEAAESRDPTKPVFKRITGARSPVASPQPERVERVGNALHPVPTMSPLPSTPAQRSLPVWSAASPPETSSTPRTASTPKGAPHGPTRRTPNSGGRKQAAHIPPPGSASKPPTFSLPSNFSWGSLPASTHSPTSPGLKFSISPDLRPKGKGS